MAKSVVNEFQPSLTEWFASIGQLDRSVALRDEDNHKNDRLETLWQVIGLQYERPTKFSAHDLRQRTPDVQTYLDEHADDLCAFRLVPTNPVLPKLRNRGLTVADCYHTWFLQQQIVDNAYDVFICPHTDKLLWSAIFVVRPEMIFGEIVEGMHNQLTQGETVYQVRQFQYDFTTWQWVNPHPDAAAYAQAMVEALHVTDLAQQAELTETLGAQFSHGYVCGYFETTVWPDQKVYFIDYNRIVSEMVGVPAPFAKAEAVTLQGVGVSHGVAQGQVRIVAAEKISEADFNEGDILVCDYTDVRFLPLMRKAGAIVTDRGGMLSHAAIISRELKIPCVVSTKNATQVLNNGDRVEVDATRGTVRKL